ncbi:hypothetical protein ACF1CY_000757 [Providencia rettgeri]
MTVRMQSIEKEMAGASHALKQVIRLGFTVLHFEIGKHHRPTFTVTSTALCQQLIDSGQAARFSDNHHDGRHIVKYQYPVGNCRVIWEEHLA